MNLPRRTYLVILSALIVAGAANAQTNLQAAGYRELTVISSDETVYNLATGQIRFITRANLVLIADTENETLPIRANRVDFEYTDDEGAIPARILLTGKVEIEHPQGRISADKVDMNFEANEATFTGDPVIYNANFPEGYFAEQFILDLEKEEIHVKGGRAPKMILADPDPADRLKLSAASVTDWRVFLAALKSQIAAEANSPGKHIGSLLEPVVRNALAANEVEAILQQQDSIISLLNKLLAQPNFYNAAAWSGIEISGETRDRLNTPLDKLDKATLTWANRSALHAAYPDTVAEPPALSP